MPCTDTCTLGTWWRVAEVATCVCSASRCLACHSPCTVSSCFADKSLKDPVQVDAVHCRSMHMLDASSIGHWHAQKASNICAGCCSVYSPGSLPQTLGVGKRAVSCSSMATDRSTAVMSATPLACRWGMRQPVPEPTSSRRVLGPRPGIRPTISASLCSDSQATWQMCSGARCALELNISG